MRTGSLCSGYGGLDLAVGGSLAWVSDTDRNATALLAHRYPQVPNLDDLTVVDWDTVERVDVITAGWPCQPFSHAGRRRGAEDERAIWPGVARAVRMVRPRLVVLENVAAVVGSGELQRVVSDLAGLGYVGSWTCVRASDVGAPHRRERLFVVAADSEGDGRPEGWTGSAQREGAGGQPPGHISVARDTEGGGRDERRHGDGEGQGRPFRVPQHLGGVGVPAADTDDGGRDGRAPDTGREQVGRTAAAGNREDPAADADLDGPQGVGRQHPGERDTDGRSGAGTTWGPYEPAIRRWERVLGRAAPVPTVGGRLNPRMVEWMMGLPDGWVCDVPGLSRTAQLKLLGNGVVPQQAAHALRLLGDG